MNVIFLILYIIKYKTVTVNNNKLKKGVHMKTLTPEVNPKGWILREK